MYAIGKEDLPPVTVEYMEDLTKRVQSITSPDMYMDLVQDLQYVMNQPNTTDPMRQIFLNQIKPVLEYYRFNLLHKEPRQPFQER